MRVSVPVPESKSRLTTYIKSTTREMLSDYVDLLSAQVGTRVDIAEVVDAMLSQFMRGDREFMSKRKDLEDERARAATRALSRGSDEHSTDATSADAANTAGEFSSDADAQRA